MRNTSLYSSIAALAVVMAIGSSIVTAQGNPASFVVGTDKALSEKAGKLTCYVYPNYLVGVSSAGTVGENILLKAKTPQSFQPCQQSPDDTVIKNDDAHYFAGVSGSTLLIDNGTGPSHRKILLYELTQNGKLRYQSEYNSATVAPGTNGGTASLVLWRTVRPAGAGECTTVNGVSAATSGLTAVMEGNFSVDFTAYAERALGKTRCALQQ